MLTIREAEINDLPTLLEIYNDAILTTTATFDLEPVTIESRRIWFQKYGGKYPIIVAEVEGSVIGYACLSPFREKEAYEKTTELSIYISSTNRGGGIGKSLMKELLTRARELNYHAIMSGITAGNAASVKLHEKFGFVEVGCFKEVGFKFNRWQDVLFYQLIISDDIPLIG